LKCVHELLARPFCPLYFQEILSRQAPIFFGHGPVSWQIVLRTSDFESPFHPKENEEGLDPDIDPDRERTGRKNHFQNSLTGKSHPPFSAGRFENVTGFDLAEDGTMQNDRNDSDLGQAETFSILTATFWSVWEWSVSREGRSLFNDGSVFCCP